MNIFIRNLKNNKKLILINNPEKSAIYYDGTKSAYKAVSEIPGLPNYEKGKIIVNLSRALKSHFHIKEKQVHIRKWNTVNLMIKDEEAGIILMSRDNHRWMKFTSLDISLRDISKQGFKIIPEYVLGRCNMNHLWYVDLRDKLPISLSPINGLKIDLDTNKITEMGNYKEKVIWNE
jgi:hypothetical protein